MIYVGITAFVIGIAALLIAIFNPFKRNEEQCIHMWGPVEDGWQYCTKCSAARIAGCVHNWEEVKKSKITRGTDDGHIRLNLGDEIYYRCSKCSQMKYVRTSLSEEPIVKLI